MNAEQVQELLRLSKIVAAAVDKKRNKPNSASNSKKD